MKVKVGDKVYDAEKDAVMVILTEQDKKNIRDMHPDCTKYCVSPKGKHTEEEIKKWMEEI